MELVWNGSRVELFRDGRFFASAKWRGGGLVERVGELTEAEWTETEELIRREAASTITSAFEAAYDARGVDVTQIERMLALSPRERLESLDAGRRTILELAGDAADLVPIKGQTFVSLDVTYEWLRSARD